MEFAYKQNGLKGSAGFSLVELMVVVAIIGILASIAVPQFQSFAYKARLTEAKAGLTSIYTAEKAFYGEWMQYDSRFGAIGLQPEGQYYFNIGFAEVVTSDNYVQSGVTVVIVVTNTKQYCGDLPKATSTTSAGTASNVTGCENMASSSSSAADLSAGTAGGEGVAGTAGDTAMDNATATFTAAAKADTTIHPRGESSLLKISEGRVITQDSGAL